jgi:Flp pilus assembly secretin CpaC
MRTIGLLTLCAVFGLVTAMPAQDAPAPFAPAGGAVARPFPASAKPVELKPATVGRDETRQQILTADQAAMVLQAANYLAAAGYSDDAAMLRERVKQVRTEQQKLLAEKTEQLKKLEAEIRELRRLSGQPSQFQITVQFVEVSRTRLRELGLNASFRDIYEAKLAELQGTTQLASAQIDPAAKQLAAFSGICNRQAVAASLELLRRERAAKILSESTLTTLDGRPAVAALSGGEYPIVIPDQQGARKIEYRDFGARTETVVFSEPGNRVRLEMRPELSELDLRNQVTIDGTVIPAINTTRLNTTVAMEIGQTAILGGLIAQSKSTAPDGTTIQYETERFILATVEQVPEPAKPVAEPP